MRFSFLLFFLGFVSLHAIAPIFAKDDWLKEKRRPYPVNRKFNSTAVNAYIEKYKPQFKSPNISMLFENCLPNTLDTTVNYDPQRDPLDTFVVTGDIHAMWLRDSTNQVLPYLRFMKDDKNLQNMICGVIRRQSSQVLLDPYSNAFNDGQTGSGSHDNVHKPYSLGYCDQGEVFESKYELDSLMNVLKLSTRYFQETGDNTCFDTHWFGAVTVILSQLKTQQKGTMEEMHSPAYMFQRSTNSASETLILGGRGRPVKRTGMSKSYFRPSDDATLFPFLIPSNAMASVELRNLATMLGKLSIPPAFASILAQTQALQQDITTGIQKFALTTRGGNEVYSYEVDGYGNAVFMDDANIPSLLSFPYLGFVNKDDPTYVRTRKLILSEDNPYYFTGKAGHGVGGVHKGLGYIWPMAIIMQAMTSTDDAEIAECLDQLVSSSVNMGFIHESFFMDDAKNHSRDWFAWANSLFAELIMQLIDERPHLVLKQQ